MRAAMAVLLVVLRAGRAQHLTPTTASRAPNTVTPIGRDDESEPLKISHRGMAWP